MARRKALARKQPMQQRSQHTVEAILEGAVQIFTAKGYEGATMNAIAERAGVSIGSIYQYYASKDAMVVALMEHHMRVITDNCVALAEQVKKERPPIEAVVARFVDELTTLYAKNPTLTKVLFEEAPRPSDVNQFQAERMVEVTRAIVDMFSDYPEIRSERLSLASLFSVMLGDALMRYIALMPVGLFPKETLIGELTHAIVQYLVTPPGRSRASGADAVAGLQG